MFELCTIRRTVSGHGRDKLLCLDASAEAETLAAFAGTAQAVYIDPPFMTGAEFRRRRPVGERGWRTGNPSATLEGYSDRFATREDYLAMLRGLIANARSLLTPSGVLCLHVDWRSSAYARLLCDQVFGEERFINELVWAYESGGRSRRYFSRKHDTILLYARGHDYRFRIDRVPIPREGTRRNHLKRGVDEDGRAYGSVMVGGKEYRYYDDEPTYPSDVWTDIGHLQQRDPERNGYPTQKPLRLLDRLLRPLVEPGETVADLCCGSGTALEAARRLGSGFIGCDTSGEAIAISEQRMGLQDMTVEAVTSDAEAELYGECDPSGVIILSGFEVRHAALPASLGPMDALESWGSGRIVGDTLLLEQVFTRGFRSPELPPMALISPGRGDIGVLTVDATGVRRVFRWRSE